MVSQAGSTGKTSDARSGDGGGLTPALVIREDRWLSDAMSHPVYSIALSASPEWNASHARASSDALLRHMGGQTRAMYFCKVASTNVDAMRWLSTLGYYVVDVNITLECPSKAALSKDVPVSPAGGKTRLAEPRDHDALLSIAERCFRYSRFHLDPAIPNVVANHVKRQWIGSYLEGNRGEALWVAEFEGRVAGFLAVLSLEADGVSTRLIDLIGVDPDLQKRGVGRDLVSAFMRHYAPACERFRVGTQVANVPSLRLYEGLGFRARASTTVLHRHVPHHDRQWEA